MLFVLKVLLNLTLSGSDIAGSGGTVTWVDLGSRRIRDPSHYSETSQGGILVASAEVGGRSLSRRANGHKRT